MSEHSKLIKSEDLWENVSNGYYDHTAHERDEDLLAHVEDRKELRRELRNDLAKHYEVVGHPKEKLLFRLCVVHANGRTMEIWNKYSDFVHLLK